MLNPFCRFEFELPRFVYKSSPGDLVEDDQVLQTWGKHTVATQTNRGLSSKSSLSCWFSLGSARSPFHLFFWDLMEGGEWSSFLWPLFLGEGIVVFLDSVSCSPGWPWTPGPPAQLFDYCYETPCWAKYFTEINQLIIFHLYCHTVIA